MNMVWFILGIVIGTFGFMFCEACAIVIGREDELINGLEIIADRIRTKI